MREALGVISELRDNERLREFLATGRDRELVPINQLTSGPDVVVAEEDGSIVDAHEDSETPPSGLVEQVCANTRLYCFLPLRAVFVRVFFLLAAIAFRITSNYDSDG